MSKKRTIDEIIEKKNMHINQAKNKGNEISDSPSEETIETSKKNFKKDEIKVAKKDLEDIRKINSKKDKSSDWSNIKFNKGLNNENINNNKKINVLIEKKIKEKFEYEIQKWVEKKIPRLLEIEMKKKTKIAYKKN